MKGGHGLDIVAPLSNTGAASLPRDAIGML